MMRTIWSTLREDYRGAQSAFESAAERLDCFGSCHLMTMTW